MWLWGRTASLRTKEALERGITQGIPEGTDAADGFGKAPPLRGDDENLEPKQSRFDPEVWEEFKKRQTVMLDELSEAQASVHAQRKVRDAGGLIIEGQIAEEIAAKRAAAAVVFADGVPVIADRYDDSDRAIEAVLRKESLLSPWRSWTGEVGDDCWYDSSEGHKADVGKWLTKNATDDELHEVACQIGYQGDANKIQDMVRTVYSATQEGLAKRLADGTLPGVDADGMITLYRGVRDQQAREARADRERGEELLLGLRSISSWTTTHDQAAFFSGKDGVVVRQRVHISRVFAQWEMGVRSATGFAGELEWILVYPEDTGNHSGRRRLGAIVQWDSSTSATQITIPGTRSFAPRA